MTWTTVEQVEEEEWRGELPGLGPLTIKLNIYAKTNGINANNMLL